MKYTENNRFNLPESSDAADITKLNANFKQLDVALAKCLTKHPDISVDNARTVTTNELTWDSETNVLVSVGVDDFGHATSRIHAKLKMPSNPVPTNIAKNYTTTNPALSVSEGVCTWNVTHNLKDISPIVAIFDNTENKQILTDVVVVDANNIKIQICSDSEIAEGTYRIKVIV